MVPRDRPVGSGAAGRHPGPRPLQEVGGGQKLTQGPDRCGGQGPEGTPGQAGGGQGQQDITQGPDHCGGQVGAAGRPQAPS